MQIALHFVHLIVIIIKTIDTMEENEMAVSKNNRKKGKKRKKGHMDPQKLALVSEKETETTPEEKTDWLSFVSVGILLVGFLGAMFTSYGLIFYPITFAGALMSLLRTKWDTTSHKISNVCYIVYGVTVAIVWIGMLTGKATITSIRW